MIVDQLLIENIEEIIQADKLGMQEPKRVLISRPMLVSVHDIKIAYINKDNNIEILVEGLFYEIKYTANIWNIIKKSITERLELN